MTGRILPIHLAPVAKRDEGQFVLRHVEIINDPVVAKAEAKLASSGHAVVREGIEAAAHVTDFCHDKGGDILRKPGKSGVELRRKYLRRRTGHRVTGGRCASVRR